MEILAELINRVSLYFTGTVILFVSLAALIFLVLYLLKSREYKSLHKRFKTLNKRYGEVCRNNIKLEGKINLLMLELDRLKSESAEVSEDA